MTSFLVATAHLELRDRWHQGPSSRAFSHLRGVFETIVQTAANFGAELVVLPSISALPATIPTDRGTEAGQCPDTEAFYDELGRTLARQAGLYVCPGSVLVKRNHGIEHISRVYDPAGKVVLTQGQTHFSRLDWESGFKPWDELVVADGPQGVRIGLVLGRDGWIPEIHRILALRGVRLIIAPLARPYPYTPWQQAAGLWQETQQNQVFAVESGLTVRMGRSGIDGRATIFGPCELSPGETGILADAHDLVTIQTGPGPIPAVPGPVEVYRGEFAWRLLTAALDFVGLEKVRKDYPIESLLNPVVYRTHFPHVYYQKQGDWSDPEQIPRVPENGGEAGWSRSGG
jgi:predicted amidohydrolase